MKLINQGDEIQIVDSQEGADVWKLIREMTALGPLDEPFYVCSVDDIVRKHKIWLEKMPRVQPFYAVKCNDSEIVLATLAALGTGFDCASRAEINKVLAFGVAPERIVFANPTKPNSHIRHASQTGVRTMTFDSDIELHKIKIYCPDAKLVLRIRCDAEVAQCPLGRKYGCDPHTEAPALIQFARSLNLDVVGISFHVGSGCADFPIYYKAIAMARELFDFAATLGYDFSLLDIGGGFPGDNDKTIDGVAAIINQALDEFFQAAKSVRVIAEPGRFYVASAYTLVTNIHSKKESLDPATGIRHASYYINDGVYGSFNCLLYDHQKLVPRLLREPPAGVDPQPSTIWGPTCDALDQICEAVPLPPLAIGDYIIFENMGAYTIPVASPFNGFPLPHVRVFVGKETWTMLKKLLPADIERLYPSIAETLAQMVENAVCA